MKRILSVIAVILLVLGFGIIHSTNIFIEKTGSVFIGVGALFLIVQLISSMKK